MLRPEHRVSLGWGMTWSSLVVLDAQSIRLSVFQRSYQLALKLYRAPRSCIAAFVCWSTFRLEIEARSCCRFLSLDRSLNLLPLSVSGVSLRKRGHKTKGRECLSIDTYWR